MILFALGTEVDAVKMYRSMIRNAPKEQRDTLKHILKEEMDHIKELYMLLSPDEKVQAKQTIREVMK